MILAVEVSILYFLSNEDDLSHSTQKTFPGSIKDHANTPSVSSSHIFWPEQTDLLFLIHSRAELLRHLKVRFNENEDKQTFENWH